MKVRDCFDLNPSGNTNKFTDYINYIDTSSVNAGALDGVEYLESDFPSRAQRLIKQGDILYSSVRPNLRHYYLYKDTFEHTVASTGFVLLRNKSEYNTEFAFYYLTTNEIVKHLSNIAELSQSTFPSFSPDDLGAIDLPDFDSVKQKKIVSILSAYDKLIEVNNKRIKVLEQMTENLYMEWFVRFRFPGHENSEFESGIPKGWRKVKIKDIAKEVGICTKVEKRDKYSHYLPIDALPSRSMVLREEDDIKNAESSLESFMSGNILFGAMRPYFHKVLLAPFDGLTRTTCFIIDARRSEYQLFLYFLLYDDTTIDFVTTISVGSTMPYVRWKDLERMNTVEPKVDVVKKFNEVIAPIMERFVGFYRINNNLTRQRDLLLARLMSGKLEV